MSETPTSVAPLYNRSETSLAATLSVLFKLAPSEGRVLAKLMMNDRRTRDELCGVARKQVISTRSLTVVVHMLRAKLNAYGILISTFYKRGYGIDAQSRTKICELIAEHDAGIKLARLPLKTKPNLKLDVQPDASA